MAKFNVPHNDGDSLGWNAFYVRGFDVTPNDGADLATVSRGLRVGTAGDVKVTTVAGDVLTLKNVQVGEIVPYFVKRVWATGTTATFITGGE